MDDAAFTSELATNRIAGRTVRGMSASSLKAAEIMGSLMNPIAKQLYNSGKAKMRRGALKLISSALHRRLQNHEGVLDLHYETLIGPLSSNETYHIRFLMLIGDGDEQWAEFVAVEALLTRTSSTMAINPTDFHVHKHALARYMQRKRKPLTEFFKEVIEPIQTSIIIGCSSVNVPSENVALPMGDGLLLGRVVLYSTKDGKNVPTSLVMTLNGRDRPSLEQVERRTILTGLRCQTEILTYVDGDALTESRARLHGKLTEFGREHEQGIRTVFETAVYEHKMIWASEIAGQSKAAEAAVVAARDLVNGPVWARFASSAGAKSA